MAPPIPSSGNSSSLSKAQRILGTDNELNIDSPTRSDGHSWGYPSSSRSSGMSISISESTQSTRSTIETESLSGSNADRWEHESGVFPRAHRLKGKASSTLLGQHHGEDARTDTSSLSRRMRHEGSDSTLKSYYDRQKSPLSISQQTSASSARDLALRKGFPPVIPRSPLLQVDSVDPYDHHYAEHNNEDTISRDKSSKKKPARLDLSMLFSRSKKNGSEILSPASISTNASIGRASSSSRRKLRKAPSKESVQSQQHSIRSPQPHYPKERQSSATDTLYHLYDNYEHLPVRSPPMGQIPESSVPNPQKRKDRINKKSNADSRPAKTGPNLTREAPSQAEPSKTNPTHLSPSNAQTFSWKNVRSNATSPPWEVSSAASVSSHNTKTSRHTSASMFSNQDLKQSSVLSLSSESEGEVSDAEPPRSPAVSYNEKSSQIPNGFSQRSPEDRRHSTKQSEVLESRKRGSRKSSIQTSPFLTIPEGSIPSSRISGPWLPVNPEYHRQPSVKSHLPDKREKRSSKKPASLSSQRSSHHPTPPLSPNSMEFRDVKERSSRYMAVTQQEEALLEALRQKRARMREKIIEEHETAKSPSREPNSTTSRFSEASSVSTLRGPDNSHGERILLYLNTPVSDAHPIDTAEPSPDLSDFLTFGSDEESSTPRTSYVAPQKDKPRPDSSTRRNEKIRPITPSSAARLSAVGAHGFRDGRSEPKKPATPSVRFINDRRLTNQANPQDFLLDDNESDIVWGI